MQNLAGSLEGMGAINSESQVSAPRERSLSNISAKLGGVSEIGRVVDEPDLPQFGGNNDDNFERSPTEYKTTPWRWLILASVCFCTITQTMTVMSLAPVAIPVQEAF